MELDLEAEREINDQLEYDKNQRLDKTNDRKYKNDYRFPSGKKIYGNSYYVACLNKLLKTYKEDEILVNKSSISYKNNISYNYDKLMDYLIYFQPTIMINNTIIEVDYEELYKYKNDKINEDYVSVVKLGYEINRWIFSNDAKKVIKKIHYFFRFNG